MKREMSLALAQRARERASTPEGRARDLYMDMRDARDLLKSVLEAAGKPGGSNAREREGRRDAEDNRRRLEQILERSEREARDLEKEIKRLQEDLRTQQERRDDGRSASRQPISDRYFRELTDTVRRRNSASEKLSVIRLSAQSDWFTCTQLRELLGLVGFGSDQETVAITLYPRLVDQGRFYTLSDAFRYSSSWRTVCERLRLPI